jgi:hypothetical protein
MWTDYFSSSLMLVTMAMMLRASFELQAPSPAPEAALMPAIVPSTPEEWRIKREEWSRKAVEGYARAQEKKWRNWDETMFKAKLI